MITQRRRQVFARNRQTAPDPSGPAASGPAAAMPPVSREEEERLAPIWSSPIDGGGHAAPVPKVKRTTLRLKKNAASQP
jgi:hypothetical protein